MDKAGIKHDPRNARRHTVRNTAMIEQSIQRDGFGRSILLANDGTVIAGNATVDAAASAGLDDVIVVETDGTKVIAVKRTDVAPGSTEFHNLALADNRAAELAEWDADVLAGLQDDIDLSQFFGDEELNRIFASVTTEGLTDPDAVPDVPHDPATKPGDLWLLGRHRLLCGDATVVTDVDRLMGGDHADMVWTDPPYGVDYVGKTSDALTIRNDGASGLAELLRGAFAMITVACRAGAPVYIAHPPGALSLVFGQAVIEAGWRFHETLIWAKDRFVLGRSDYHYQHEPILHVEVPPFGYEWDAEGVILGYLPGGEGRRGRGGSGWFGDNRQSSVFDIPRPKASRQHPTMKPVELIQRMVLNSSPPGGVVYDPFGGSGSTVIACEANDRRAVTLELDPHYCDVIVKRWEQFTGQQAVLESLVMAAD